MSPAVLLLLAQSLGTTPAPPPSPDLSTQPYTLQQLDTDHDGSVSPQEAAAVPSLSAQFHRLDANGDGALEPAEFARFDANASSGATAGQTPPRR